MDDPFAILALPPRFSVTPAEVQAAYLKVVTRLHPDRARDPLERDEFMRKSAAAGQAKQQLMTELGRAEAVLSTMGGTANAPLSPAFLAETLEIRERIEEATGGEAPELRAIASDVEAMRTQCVRDLAAALENADAVSARAALARLRYVERMRTRLQQGSEQGV